MLLQIRREFTLFIATGRFPCTAAAPKGMTMLDLPRLLTVWRTPLLILTGLALVRLALVLPYGPQDDEAYYWMWGLRPALSHFDHSAGVAWLGWLWMSLAGPSMAGLKVLAAILSIIAGLASLAAVRTLQETPTQPSAGLWSGLNLAAWAVGLSTLLAFITWSPDVPLLLFFALGLWQAARLLRHPTAMGAWIWTGLFWGLALLGKEIMLPYAALFCLCCLFHMRLRAQILGAWQPWVGVALMISAGLPTLMWNMQNDWTMIVFLTKHGFQGGDGSWNWDQTLGISLVFFGFMGPLAFAPLRRWFWTRQWWARSWPLWVMALGPFAAFTVIALYKSVHVNWVLLSIHGVLVLTLARMPLAPRATPRGFRPYFLSVGAVIIAVFAVPSFAWRFTGLQAPLALPKVMAHLNAAYLQPIEGAAPPLVLANTYEVASQLNFLRYAQDREPPLIWPALNFESRGNHYDFLTSPGPLGGRRAIVVTRDKLPPAGLFTQIEAQEILDFRGVKYGFSLGTLIDHPRSAKNPRANATRSRP